MMAPARGLERFRLGGKRTKAVFRRATTSRTIINIVLAIKKARTLSLPGDEPAAVLPGKHAGAGSSIDAMRGDRDLLWGRRISNEQV
jgi:hypothetical protein